MQMMTVSEVKLWSGVESEVGKGKGEGVDL